MWNDNHKTYLGRWDGDADGRGLGGSEGLVLIVSGRDESEDEVD